MFCRIYEASRNLGPDSISMFPSHSGLIVHAMFTLRKFANHVFPANYLVYGKYFSSIFSSPREEKSEVLRKPERERERASARECDLLPPPPSPPLFSLERRSAAPSAVGPAPSVVIGLLLPFVAAADGHGASVRRWVGVIRLCLLLFALAASTLLCLGGGGAWQRPLFVLLRGKA